MFQSEPPPAVPNFTDVTVNNFSAEVINRVGWSTARDQYRVDVRLPQVAPGEASLQLTSAYIPGAPFKIPVK